MNTWLFRNNPNQVFTYSAGDDADLQEVIHPMTVHLPDVEQSSSFFKAAEFLKAPLESDQEKNLGEEKSITYGRRFDQKYRNPMSCPSCNNFTFD